MKFKINFFKIWEYASILKELNKYAQIVKQAKIQLSQPFSNFLLQLKRNIVEFKNQAKQTDTPLDDEFFGFLDVTIDKLLVWCHLDDDYQKFSELEKEITPK